jgi:dTDP-4-dehydrorhamnose 3,5-epimerase
MDTPELRHQPVYKDERGVFSPVSLYNYNDSLIDKNWVQVNTSVSDYKYTFRGLHLQLSPFEQTKYLTVIKGKILDFVVNCNHLNKDYGKIHVFEVDENHAVLVPRGYAHGLLTLEDNTIVQYLVDSRYSFDHEVSVQWNTVPGLEQTIKDLVPHFTESYLTISDKDRDGTDFKDVRVI